MTSMSEKPSLSAAKPKRIVLVLKKTFFIDDDIFCLRARGQHKRSVTIWISRCLAENYRCKTGRSYRSRHIKNLVKIATGFFAFEQCDRTVFDSDSPCIVIFHGLRENLRAPHGLNNVLRCDIKIIAHLKMLKNRNRESGDESNQSD